MLLTFFFNNEIMLLYYKNSLFYANIRFDSGLSY
jgi:hypothetical protein